MNVNEPGGCPAGSPNNTNTVKEINKHLVLCVLSCHTLSEGLDSHDSIHVDHFKIKPLY